MSLLDRFVILFDTDSSEATQEVNELGRRLSETEKRANDAVDSFTEFDDETKSLIKSMMSLGLSTQDIISNLSDMGHDTDLVIKQLDKISGAISDVGDEANRADGETGNLIGDLKKLAIGYLSLSAIKSVIMDTAALTDAVGKLSQTYGINIEKMDAWGEAVKRNGGSADAFQSTAISLKQQLGEIQFGGGTEILTTLSMMGVNAFNSNGRLKDTFEILESISGAFQNMSSGASSILGKKLGLDQGTILTLQQGRHNLKALVEQQENLGVATLESYNVSADFNDSLDNLDRSILSIWRSINIGILPALTSMANGMTDIVQWMKKNSDFVTGVFIGIATAITLFALPALTSLAGSVLALAAPFLAVAVPIAAVGVAIGLLYEDVKAYVSGQSSLLGDLAEKYGWFKTVLDGLIEGSRMFWEDLVGLFDWSVLLFTNPLAAVNQMTSKLMSELSQLWEWIKNLFDFSFIGDSIMSIAGLVGFGSNDEMEAIRDNTHRILVTSDIYGQNPLNTSTSYSSGNSTYNKNNFSFSNSIQAKGVTPEQVSSQLNDEFGRQVSVSFSMLDDGVYQ